MEVRIVPAHPYAHRPETDYVRVQTYSDPADDTVTLATIERVVEKANRKADAEANGSARVKTLVMRLPMSIDAALGFAASYAERKKIPVVYAERPQAES